MEKEAARNANATASFRVVTMVPSIVDPAIAGRIARNENKPALKRVAIFQIRLLRFKSLFYA